MSLPSLDRVDPGRAWQPWQPDDNQPWSLRWAGHLYRRAAFGGTLAELRQAVKAGPHATVDRLLAGDPEAKGYESLIADTGQSIAKGEDESALRGWWLYAMLNSGHPLREKLTLFWHNHFATSIAKVRSTTAMYAQNQALRRHALGNFRPMLADMSRDPAMLVWLDSNRNVKGQANENYAREVMELFTLGTGHYTETDIREAARAFTGWHADGDKFAFSPRFHDDGPKAYLGQTGNWDGTDIQRIILSQPAAARFLVRKLYSYFIAETPAPPDALLEPLAERFRQSDYDIADLIGTMLRAHHFFSEYAYRRRVKSPVEYAVGVIRTMRPAASPKELVQPLEAMGQSLFAPPNVKGWPGGKTWLNSATVLARQNFAQAMTALPGQSGPATVPNTGLPANGTLTISTTAVDVAEQPAVPPPPQDDVVALVERDKATEPAAVVNLLADMLLQGDIDEPTRKKLTAFFADGKPEKAVWQQRVRETAHALLTLPEYTLA
jgi:uncharacterized protein (DUF1800 family)